MNIVFRVDASTQMGTGHLVRCLTLAEELGKRGANIRFVCRNLPGNLIATLNQDLIPVTVLPAPQSMDDEAAHEDYSRWLGVTQLEDAEQTIKALNGARPDCLIVDHYSLDVIWEKKLRPYTGKLLAIDDLANRQHDCDVLLDQNYSTDAEHRYQNLLPDTCISLQGPRYALIKPEYRVYRKMPVVSANEVSRIFVFFGGTDPHNMTGLTLRSLSSAGLKHLQVDLVIGANNPNVREIENLAAERKRTIIHRHCPHLADLMREADLAIGAGGATTWERMCLGLPTITISIAENQLPACKALAESRLIHYSGHFTDITTEQLIEDITALSLDPDRLKVLETRGKIEVDGFGVMRVSEVLLPGTERQIQFRPVSEEDAVYSFGLAGDRPVWSDADDTKLDPWSRYYTHFKERLARPDSRQLMLEIAGLPLANLQFDADGDEVTIDYVLDPVLRERNWDALVIRAAVKKLYQSEARQLSNTGQNQVASGGPRFLKLAAAKLSKKSSSSHHYLISILSDQASWLNERIRDLQFELLAMGHRVQWVHESGELRSGDFCFLLGCSQLVSDQTLARYRHNLVVHESDLPHGKGWSPLTWQILEGRHRVPVTLLEASEKVDSGSIYLQQWLELEGHELIDEWREAQASATLNLCKEFVTEFPDIIDLAVEQSGEESHYPRRQPQDSELNPGKSLAEQFNLLRVVDNERYPAFFENRSHRYTIKIEKAEKW